MKRGLAYAPSALVWALSALIWTAAAAPARAEPSAAELSAAERRGGCPAESANGAQAAQAVTTVDLNSADERALLDLPGIGPARARAIVAYRSAHGPFRSLSQLLQIKGIGRALLKQLRPLVAVTPPPG